MWRVRGDIVQGGRGGDLGGTCHYTPTHHTPPPHTHHHTHTHRVVARWSSLRPPIDQIVLTLHFYAPGGLTDWYMYHPLMQQPDCKSFKCIHAAHHCYTMLRCRWGGPVGVGRSTHAKNKIVCAYENTWDEKPCRIVYPLWILVIHTHIHTHRLLQRQPTTFQVPISWPCVVWQHWLPCRRTWRHQGWVPVILMLLCCQCIRVCCSAASKVCQCAQASLTVHFSPAFYISGQFILSYSYQHKYN